MIGDPEKHLQAIASRAREAALALVECAVKAARVAKSAEGLPFPSEQVIDVNETLRERESEFDSCLAHAMEAARGFQFEDRGCRYCDRSLPDPYAATFDHRHVRSV